MSASKILHMAMWLLFVATVALGEPATYDSAYQEGRVHERYRRWQEAREAFTQAIELAPDAAKAAPARLYRARCALALGLIEEGRNELEAVAGMSDVAADLRSSALDSLGESHLDAGEHDKARAAFQRILDLPDVPYHHAARAWVEIGNVEFELGRTGAAREAYERAVEDPKVAPVHLRDAWPRIGDCWMTEQNYAEARKAYRRVLAAENADEIAKGRALAGIGHSYYEAGDYAGACDAYATALKSPRTPRELLIVERLDTIHRDALRKAARLLAEEEYAEARKVFHNVLGMEGVKRYHVGSARVGLGDAYLAMENVPMARAEYRHALFNQGTLWLDRGRAQIGLAQSYEAEGELAKARAEYEKVMTMKNLSAAQTALAQEKVKTLR